MKILHIFDVSNYIYIGNVKHENAIRGVRECDGQYIPNRAPIGGITFLTNKILQVAERKEDMFLAFDRKPTLKQKMFKDTFGFDKEYKGQRTRDLKIFLQKEYAEKLIMETGIAGDAVDAHEADDLIYTIWKTYYGYYDYIRIHTEDSDLAFMVDMKTEILPVRADGRHITVDNYHYSVHKNEVIPYNMSLLLKMVQGDKSDNIAGTGDAVGWVTAMKDITDRYPEFDMRLMGDVNYCKRFIIKVINEHPDLKNAHNALNIFNLVTPCLINPEEIVAPSSECNLRMLRALSGIARPCQEFPILENTLKEYIDEFNR